MSLALAIGLAVHTITWQDLTSPAQRLWSELTSGTTPFNEAIYAIRARNIARLREGEIDHLIFYLLQNPEFTPEPPVDPALASVGLNRFATSIQRRTDDLLRALERPSEERQQYLATLIPRAGRDAFVRAELARVLRWIREKETGCRSAPSPQSCIAALYTSRGHSSDTSPASMIAVEAAFRWLAENGRRGFQRILVIGPGSDFAPRAAGRSGPVQVYQPQLLRKLFPEPVTVDCVDLNPRVLKSAAGDCDSTDQLDIAVERLDATYDAIVATNVLLYLDRAELLPAFSNIRAMLRAHGVFIHNDGRFETNLFGKAAGLPVTHFGSVDLDATRRPAIVDRFVIHSPAAPKL